MPSSWNMRQTQNKDFIQHNWPGFFKKSSHKRQRKAEETFPIKEDWRDMTTLDWSISLKINNHQGVFWCHLLRTNLPPGVPFLGLHKTLCVLSVYRFSSSFTWGEISFYLILSSIAFVEFSTSTMLITFIWIIFVLQSYYLSVNSLSLTVFLSIYYD